MMDPGQRTPGYVSSASDLRTMVHAGAFVMVFRPTGQPLR
jgi:hypothetical protein